MFVGIKTARGTHHFLKINNLSSPTRTGTGVSINISGVSIVTRNITVKLLSFVKFIDRYIASMPVDVVKFYISLVHSLEEGGRQAIIVENLAKFIHDTGSRYRLQTGG